MQNYQGQSMMFRKMCHSYHQCLSNSCVLYIQFQENLQFFNYIYVPLHFSVIFKANSTVWQTIIHLLRKNRGRKITNFTYIKLLIYYRYLYFIRTFSFSFVINVTSQSSIRTLPFLKLIETISPTAIYFISSSVIFAVKTVPAEVSDIIKAAVSVVNLRH